MAWSPRLACSGGWDGAAVVSAEMPAPLACRTATGVQTPRGSLTGHAFRGPDISHHHAHDTTGFRPPTW